MWDCFKNVAHLFLEFGPHDGVDVVDALLWRVVVRDLARLHVLLRQQVIEGPDVLGDLQEFARRQRSTTVLHYPRGSKDNASRRKSSGN